MNYGSIAGNYHIYATQRKLLIMSEKGISTLKICEEKLNNGIRGISRNVIVKVVDGWLYVVESKIW